MATLRVALPNHSIQEFEITDEVTTIGRISSNKIQIDDSSVSEFHAKFVRSPQGYRVVDLNASSQTFINDVAVSEAQLMGTYRVRFGGVECQFVGERNVSQKENNMDEFKQQLETIRMARDDAQKRMQELMRELETLRDVKDAAVDEVAYLQEQLEKTKQDKGKADELLPKIEELEKELRTVNESRESLRKQYDELKSGAEDLQRQKNDWENREKENISKLEELKQRENVFAEEKEGLESELKALREDQEKIRAEKEQSISKQQELERQIEAIIAERDQALHKGQQIADEQTETLQRIDLLDKELSAVSQKFEVVQRERDELQQKVQELENSLQEATSLIAETEGRAEWEKKEADFLSQLDTAKKQIESLTQGWDAINQQNQQLAEQIKVERKHVVSLTMQRGEAQQGVSEFIRRIEELEQEILQLKKETPHPVNNGVKIVKPLKMPPAQPVHPATEEVNEPAASANQESVQMESVEESQATLPEVSEEELQTVFEPLPASLAAMRRCLQYFVRHPGDLHLLHELLGHARGMTGRTSAVGHHAIHKMNQALESLVSDLHERPERVTPSTLRTVSQAIDFITTLLEPKNLVRSKELSRPRIFAIDDDPDVLQAIIAAMDTADLKTAGTKEPASGLEMLAKQNFDLIFMDVGLPEISGIDLCSKVRKMPNYENTPILFLTGLATVQNRVQSTLSGGNDFIGKPFNLPELVVKAQTWILKGQLGIK